MEEHWTFFNDKPGSVDGNQKEAFSFLIKKGRGGSGALSSIQNCAAVCPENYGVPALLEGPWLGLTRNIVCKNCIQVLEACLGVVIFLTKGLSQRFCGCCLFLYFVS